jgi:hypothetical protein
MQIEYSQYRLTLFLSRLILQAVSCLLSRFCGRDSEVHAVPAGFLAGAAFFFDPKLSTLVAIFTATLQQLTKSVVTVGAVPFPKLLTSAVCGLLYAVLIHCRIVDEELCHPLALAWCRLLTGGRSVLHVCVNGKLSVDQLWNCHSFKAFLLRILSPLFVLIGKLGFP